MNDTLDPDRPAPRNRARIALAVGVVLLLVAGAAVGGYLAGRSTPVEAADPCVETRQAVLDMKEEVGAAKPEVAASITRTQLNVVVQNPECFSVKERAAAQTVLDSADQEAASEALCSASDRPWWEC
ncbi:hypothetical protein [Streptomyces sp. PvR018]|uniref:hypothetical protein n=1 Tax=Streptomyces sp. PvR018 TaxID=3156442 RepID=UPI003396EA70